MADHPEAFAYDGHGLGHWLRELVAADRTRRLRAADAIQEIRFRPIDPEAGAARGHAHLEAFDAAVREAIRGLDFDAPRFVATLVRLLREPGTGRDAQEAFVLSLAASFVFLALREEILLAPDEIRTMLADPRQRWNAIQVIEWLGPKAVLFADDLFAQLDASHARRPFDAPDALAAVIHDDAGRIRSIVGRLDAPEPGVAEGAADVLYSLGRRAAEQVPESVEKLAALARRDGSPLRAAAVTALGRVAQGSDSVVELLLDLSQSGDLRVRGAAITALGDVARQPEKVVPRLIDALDDYQEQDPDWLHYSAHERVVRALAAFGRAAAPAVPSLMAKLWRDDEELDRGVIETLGQIGRGAEGTLPTLEHLAEDEGYTEEDFAQPSGLVETDDFLPLAILRIRRSLSSDETAGL